MERGGAVWCDMALAEVSAYGMVSVGVQRQGVGCSEGSPLSLAHLLSKSLSEQCGAGSRYRAGTVGLGGVSLEALTPRKSDSLSSHSGILCHRIGS